MSRPALNATGQSPPVQPGTWLCAFQSPMMKPSKPSRPFSTSVSRLLLPCILTPFHDEKLAMTIMASFSSWNGVKMHGNKSLLTDVLKGRLGFEGFIIGDWNAHSQVPGCTGGDCPVAFNAGLDMAMAPY